MGERPTTAAGYTREQVTMVRGTCLYVATKLGDLMEDLVVVGGLVPSLLINEEELDDSAYLKRPKTGMIPVARRQSIYILCRAVEPGLWVST